MVYFLLAAAFFLCVSVGLPSTVSSAGDEKSGPFTTAESDIQTSCLHISSQEWYYESFILDTRIIWYHETGSPFMLTFKVHKNLVASAFKVCTDLLTVICV